MKASNFGSRALLVAAGGLAGYGLHAYAQEASATAPLFYSGTVSGIDGAPLEGTHKVAVRMFASETSTGSLCATPSLDIAFDAGRFKVELPGGSGGCAEAVASSATWTEVSVDGEALPRTRVGAVPYAVHARVADSLVGEQAQTLASLKTKVDSLPAASVAYRVITTPDDCYYDKEVNATRCTCKLGELATSGGAWAGFGNILTASRLDVRPQEDVTPAERVRMWSVSCQKQDGTDTECIYVQAVCVKVGP
ncbi:MAG: hypothetical protein ABW352_13000 [Polyangiales bacterium]